MRFNKGDVIELVDNGNKYKCVVCDAEYAVFGEAYFDQRDGAEVVSFDKLFVCCNDSAGTMAGSDLPVQKIVNIKQGLN